METAPTGRHSRAESNAETIKGLRTVKIHRFVTTALVRDKTILSGCAPPRARRGPDSLILHREHCFQHESSVARTCPFRSVVPVRSIPESRYSTPSGRYTRTIGGRKSPARRHSVIADFRPTRAAPLSCFLYAYVFFFSRARNERNTWGNRWGIHHLYSVTRLCPRAEDCDPKIVSRKKEREREI